MNLISVFLLFSILLACDTSMVLSSVNYESCFMNYKNPAEIQASLDKLNTTFNIQKQKKTEKTILFLKPVIGCLTYQLGRYKEAEQWLLQDFKTDNKKIQNVAASVLGLMYLKEQEKQKITPEIIELSQNHYLGRWMLVLFYIDNYRESNNKEQLMKAINQLQQKNTSEGTTTATRRFLKQMELINKMEMTCAQKNNPSCSAEDLKDEKTLLFSTTYGFLSMLLKKPPLNNTPFIQ